LRLHRKVPKKPSTAINLIYYRTISISPVSIKAKVPGDRSNLRTGLSPLKKKGERLFAAPLYGFGAYMPG
jgi:hypothetical protein